jgi:hypothetical protein
VKRLQRQTVKQGWTNNLYFINWIAAWTYTLLCVVLSVFGTALEVADYSFVEVGLPLVWAEVSVFTGFMVWKTKAENLQKMKGFEAIENDPDFEVLDLEE